MALSASRDCRSPTTDGGEPYIFLYLGGTWATRRLKALRFGFINVVGRIVHHARHMVMKLAGCRETTELILGARQRILALAPPAG